tara:strand:+ start:294 stop:989 length:696 start_codon:yes stop_codon:yes gene_type:complete
MATLGLKAIYSGPCGANKKSISVTCSPGTNPGLFVVVSMANTVNFNNAFYKDTNGNFVQMQRMTRRNMVSTRQVGYWLANPPTGVALDFEVRFTGNQWNPISIYAQSFTGVGQNNLTTEHAYNLGFSGGIDGTTPHSRSITIAANDLICLSGISTQSMSNPFVIGGANAALEVNQHNVNGKFVSVAYSGTSLPAGSTVCTTVSNSGKITNQAWVIPDAVSGGSTRRRIIIC